MDNRDVYIKRMEAAVLQAGSAISKLKLENAALRKENEDLKRKRDSAEISVEYGEPAAKQSKIKHTFPDAPTKAEDPLFPLTCTSDTAESTIQPLVVSSSAAKSLLRIPRSPVRYPFGFGSTVPYDATIEFS